jgi:alanine racemase
MSHLAAADEPDSRDFTVEQARRFQRIVSGLRAAGIDCPASLANSAGILAHPDIVRDAPRPGLALYGGNPFHGTAWADKGAALKPAMEAMAPVLSVHDLPEGRSISYGRTFTAPRDMRVAIVAAGYADAFSRSLSNRGQVVLRGRRAPIVGRVCMQMTAVDVTRLEEVEPGDAAYLLGGEGETAVTPDELAEWWGTIGYEVMCLLGLGGRRYSDQG